MGDGGRGRCRGPFPISPSAAAPRAARSLPATQPGTPMPLALPSSATPSPAPGATLRRFPLPSSPPPPSAAAASRPRRSRTSAPSGSTSGSSPRRPASASLFPRRRCSSPSGRGGAPRRGSCFGRAGALATLAGVLRRVAELVGPGAPAATSSSASPSASSSSVGAVPSDATVPRNAFWQYIRVLLERAILTRWRSPLTSSRHSSSPSPRADKLFGVDVAAHRLPCASGW